MLPFPLITDKILQKNKFAFLQIGWSTRKTPMIVHWLKKNLRGEVYHLPRGNFMEFYFTDLEARNEFTEFATHTQAQFPQLFEPLGDSVSLSGSIKYTSTRLVDADAMTIVYCWMNDRIRGRVYELNNHLFFDNDDDLILFRVMFPNEDSLRDINETHYDLIGLKYPSSECEMYPRISAW